MTRNNLIEITIFSYLIGAACYNICTLVYFFWKQWSEIKKTNNISKYHISLRAYYKTKMMSRVIMLIAVIFLIVGAVYAGFSWLTLFLSLIASYFAIKGFSNIFGDFLTSDDIDKIQLCNLYLRPFDVDYTTMGLKIEKGINKYFSEYAQVFSIGNPSTILPSLGATSIFATDENWKETVKILMERAKMVFIRIGQTNGTLWELKKCVEFDYQQKSIFIIDSIQHFELLTDYINEIGLQINKPNCNEFAAIYYNHLIHSWEYYGLTDNISVMKLYDKIIESWELKEEVYEIRHKRNFYWKYLFSKRNFPNRMKPFSFGYLLNNIVYYFYNRWHPATLIYYTIGTIVAHILLRPYIYDSLYVSLSTLLIWLSLLLINITTLIFAPQISWLSKRWPSYEYFYDDNTQLNKVLCAFWKTVILYNICIYFITYFLLGSPYYIGL